MYKYHIRLKEKTTGKIIELYNNPFNKMNGVAFWPIQKDCDFIFARHFTGKQDCKGEDLYDGDIVEFDAQEWGNSDNKFLVEWDKENACWSFGGGCASDMHWRTKIGDRFDNPELLK